MRLSLEIAGNQVWRVSKGAATGHVVVIGAGGAGGGAPCNPDPRA